MSKAPSSETLGSLMKALSGGLAVKPSRGRGWKFDEWFRWPPDLFAFTSIFLKMTGAYRFAVSPPSRVPWPGANWQHEVETAAEEWRNWICGKRRRLPGLVSRNRAILHRHRSSVTIEEFRSLCRVGIRNDDDERVWEVCRALLELHAVADEACRGVGHPRGVHDDPIRNSMFYLANMLLESTGSLSRLATYKVTVLPKMRTPQVGLTLRSLSHHVTVHQSEVDVVWRTMPWINRDEDTVNIMIIPWPPMMKSTWFQPEHHSVNRESTDPARYFTIKRTRDARLKVDSFVAILNEQTVVNRVHILVFPELALCSDELGELKHRLVVTQRRDRIPMIITGLRTETPNAGLGRNQLVLSVFFAGKWYDLLQDKHHRWKLDAQQIKQYRLGGSLSSGRDWWEAIEVPERRISFLCPNGWLTLCPLICEDLARLEPVSDLIRGVGPTLLIAILLDGPQLSERWPGRYASVLADDPGTAVLTLSSLGMVTSAIPSTLPTLSGAASPPASRAVALWKDALTGWREIEIHDDEDAMILTVTATWKEEYTADGRGDGCSTAVFSLEGVRSVKAPETDSRKKPQSTPDAHISQPIDLRELSTFTHLVDAVVGVDGEVADRLRLWALGRYSPGDWLDLNFQPKHSILQAVSEAMNRNYGELSREDEREKRHEFEGLITALVGLVKQVNVERYLHDEMTYLERLAEHAGKSLRSLHPGPIPGEPTLDGATVRANVYSALGLLWAIHRRVSGHRREEGISSKTEKVLELIEQLLPEEYDLHWTRRSARDTQS